MSLVPRTIILNKEDIFALLGLASSEVIGVVYKYDPREPLPIVSVYDNEQDTEKAFNKALSTSIKNGWRVVYTGSPNQG